MTAPGALHGFVRPGQVAPDLPPPDQCVTCGQPETAHQDPARAAYIAGLRQLADLLEQHPEARLPYAGTGCGLLFQPRGASEFLSTARALGCEWTAGEWDGSNDAPYFEADGALAGLKLELLARCDELGDGLAAIRAEFGGQR